MPLSASQLATDMDSQVTAIPGINIVDPDELHSYHQALATAIVNHIVSNAQVNSGIPVTVNVSTGLGNTYGAGTVS